MRNESNNIYTLFNGAGVLIAYAMLGGSLYYAPVDFSTKGYWAMGILLLTISLVNVVKYRLDNLNSEDRINKLEAAKAEKILEEYVVDKDKYPHRITLQTSRIFGSFLCIPSSTKLV